MILTRGARVTGAVLCAVLAVTVAGWLVRDVRAVGHPGELWRYWAGYVDARPKLSTGTSPIDVAMLVVYTVAGVAALRSSVAAAALVATGVATVALRLPGVWNIGVDGMDARFPHELRTRALICAFVALAAGLALIVTAGAGRRPPRDFYDRPPTRPGRGASVTTFLLLGASGAVVIAWEIRQAVTYPSRYPEWVVGGGSLTEPLTDPPPGWGSAVAALLCLFAGISALSRAVHARPFGMIAAGLLLPGGIIGIARVLHFELLDHFGKLPTEGRLTVLTWFFETTAGVVVLLAMACRGFPDSAPAPTAQDWRHGYPQPDVFGPPPPSQPPPGW
ncbi:hypothetical protein [Streptomyces sp. NBC_01320]|uniref:hypothetical protein n=1 Tax=Streptomyces sp. NBC_01320 TaxID=2903824 RepID=UPI002E0D8431|nr:hypothetical protein OG395_22155 [Streptomyces sp. NBC_01320]